MQPVDSDDLVVSTPERVSFQYPVAGLGSRFLAQAIDMAVLVAIFLVLLYAANAVGKTTGDQRLALLIFILVSFILLFGYFWALEAIWSGQTLGKRALRLRVVGDQGEPLRFSQARHSSVSGHNSRQSFQNFGPWFICLRCATSCATR